MRSKYKAIRTEVDGISFPSKAEANRYKELKLLQSVGRVKWFIRQPSFDVGPQIRYVADFLVLWLDGTVTVEDVKGIETPVFKLKSKLLKQTYPNVELQLIK